LRAPERLSIRARLRISIVALVTAIVLALSALHLHAVIGETLDDVGERTRMVGDQVSAYLVETLNRLGADRQAAIRTDASLRRLLQRALTRSSAVVDVAVLDQSNRVLVAGDASRIGTIEDPSSWRNWEDWSKGGIFQRLWDLYGSSTDIVSTSAIGLPGSARPDLTVRVALSPVLLRQSIEPRLWEWAAVSTVSLAISALLAMIVSQLVGDSLVRLGHKIDLISRGDMQAVQKDRFEAAELADLESKLWWLGRQYSDARSDMGHLRSNIEQMLRNMEEAVLVFGPDGRLQMAGEAAERLLARPRGELLGLPVADAFPVWTGLGAELHKSIGGRSFRDRPVTFERPNLPPVKLLLSIEPINYGNETAQGMLVTLRDADTRRRIQSDLDTARKLTAIGRITSGVAHEIKNPLNAMMLHLEIAQGKSRAGEAPQSELDIVKRELLRLDRVVKTLLDFNKPVELRITACDLNDVAADVAMLMQPQAMTKGVHLITEAAPDGAPVMADPDLLRQGVLNVAINALEATASGGTICLRVEGAEGQPAIAVQDQGPGIPPEIRDKIFNLYFTTKSSGSGIGLAMTYRIMQLHSGTITVDSEVGRGTTVRLELPARQDEGIAA
jgi:signal transduction histidine kinase